MKNEIAEEVLTIKHEFFIAMLLLFIYFPSPRRKDAKLYKVFSSLPFAVLQDKQSFIFQRFCGLLLIQLKINQYSKTIC